MKAHVTFWSTSFPPAEHEASELINEGTYGRRMIDWLRAGLPQYGIEPGEVIIEDWGWLMFLKKDGLNAFVGCSTAFESAKADQECHCVIDVTPPLLLRPFRRREAAAYLADVRAAVEKMIAEHPDIRNAAWNIA